MHLDFLNLYVSTEQISLIINTCSQYGHVGPVPGFEPLTQEPFISQYN